jgi:hypothetical protein
VSASRHRAGTAAAAAGAAVVVVTVVIALVLGLGSSGSQTRSMAGSPVALPPAVGVHDASTVPLALTFPQVVVWTGSQVVMFAASPTNDNGVNRAATYDPGSGEWGQASAAPIVQPLAFADGVWTGSRLVVGGVACDNRTNPEAQELHCFPGSLTFLSYDPGSDQWQQLPSPTGLDFPPDNGGVWGEVLGVVGNSLLTRLQFQYWSLDLSTGTWSHLPDGPFPQFAKHCIIGDHLVAFSPIAGEAIGGQEIETPNGRAGIYNYDGVQIAEFDVKTGTWKQGEPLKASFAAVDYPDMLCSDTTPIVFSQSLGQVWRYDLGSGQWSSLPTPTDEQRARSGYGGPVPLNLPTTFAYGAYTGQKFAFWNSDQTVNLSTQAPPEGGPPVPSSVTRPGNALVFDLVTEQWTVALPGVGGTTRDHPHAVAWTGGFAFVPSADPNGVPVLRTYRPSEK